MKKIISITFSIFFCQLFFSQNNIDSNITLKAHKVNTVKDKRISKLNNTYQTSYSLKGYRIQIFSDNKKQPANQARSTFLRSHPKTKAHLSYEQPYYKVRVGDFRTKLEALKYKNDVADEFPNCFIVKDEIDVNELD
ncbi:MAG: SPOR domain-containing protein [Vicingaceae bacterium]